MVELNPSDKQELYAWIDEVPLSRQKRNISRDFSDGVMAAELASHFFPQYVDLHNYPPANSSAQKLNNWKTLNRKVFFKLDFEVPESILQDVVASKPGVIEYILIHFKKKVEQIKEKNNQAVPSDIFNVSHQDITHQHNTVSPTHNFSTHLPPVLTNNDHTPKHMKPSHIPRLTQSGGGSLPLINNHVNKITNPQGKKEQIKLPSIKDGISKKKFYASSQYTIVGQRSHEMQTLNTGIAMAEKDQVIMELQETIQLLTMKVNRLEHLIRVKDYKIQELEKFRR